MPDIIITPGSGLIDFYPSNKTASIYTSGNDLAFANPSGNFEFISGNVAIGTTTPSGNLHVIGTGLISSKLGVNTNSPSGSFDVAGDSYFRGATTGTVTTVYFKAPGYSDTALKLRTDSSANLYLDAGPNIKVGNQDGRAEVNAYTGPASISHTYNANGGVYGNQHIRFAPATVEAMRITPSGLVGIGTTVPSGKLAVIGSGFFGTINSPANALLHAYSAVSGDTVLNVEGTNGSLFSIVDSLSGTLMAVNNNAGLPVFEVFSDDSIVAGRFNQNDFVISSGGNVGIGTASPVSKLQVSGLITANSGNFTNSLQLNGTGVSISGHTHTGNDILLIVDGVNDTILTSGCTANLFLEQLNSNGLTEAMNVVGGALSETITNFNTSVSGLLPVKNIVAGTNVTVSSISGIYTINSTASGVGGGGGGGVVVENSGNDRILTSTGSSSGINAEANLTFNGSVLNVTGSGVFTSGIISSNFISNQSGTIIGTNGAIGQSGQMVFSQGSFSGIGDAQNSQYLLRGITSNSSWTPLKNNNTDAILLKYSRTYSFTSNILARSSTTSSNAAYKLEGLLYHDASGVAIVGTPIKTTIGENDSSWDVRVSISGAGTGGTNYLLTEVAGANAQTIYWLAKVDLLEIEVGPQQPNLSFSSAYSLTLSNSVVTPFTDYSYSGVGTSIGSFNITLGGVDSRDNRAWIAINKSGTLNYNVTASTEAGYDAGRLFVTSSVPSQHTAYTYYSGGLGPIPTGYTAITNWLDGSNSASGTYSVSNGNYLVLLYAKDGSADEGSDTISANLYIA